MERKIKVVYICHFSNKEVNTKLPLRLSWKDRIILFIKRKKITTDVEDYAVWNSNAINELKSHTNEIEIHIISPYPYLAVPNYEYSEDGIFYHFYRIENNLNSFLQRNVFKFMNVQFKKERKYILSIINKIEPNVVHLVGAENPYYSLSALDIPKRYPLIVQLQTLINDSEFEKNNFFEKNYYKYLKKVELEVLRKADFIGTTVSYFHNLIKNQINKPNFLPITLALSEPVDISLCEKKYDFVYFAADIVKAADYAIEAFILASKIHPGITLDVIGNYHEELKNQLENRLIENGIKDNVIFEGKLPTHSDVLHQIRLSKFALLPLKVDQVSGTIRESMANGLPVVTTITPATPNLNQKRQCVLLSEKGDFLSMADNMCRLIENPDLANKLRLNSGKYMNERASNASIVNRWIEFYKAIGNNRL